MEEFVKLGLSAGTVEALRVKGFKRPTPIQEKTIPLLLNGVSDVIGQAQTGTGKTACFALPILENISPKSKHVEALILTPTRELALQVSEEIKSLSGNLDLNVLAVYGGAPISEQMKRLKGNVSIVVGTPGRIIDLLKRKKLDVSSISYAVLDEADEMLNMGFIEDIKKILGATNADKKMLLFSATIPKEVYGIARKFMRDFKIVSIEDKQITPDLTKQIYYELQSKDKLEGLSRVIDTNEGFYGLIFCKTQSKVDEITNKLISKNYNTAGLHGGISQSQREKILGNFRKKKIKILVATDVAARGIDVIDLTHVINFSVPQSPESYVHRIGRTGRAGKQGIAITFVAPSERRDLRMIERVVKQKLIKENIPTIQEVINKKEEDIKLKISKIMEFSQFTKYRDLAKELLSKNKPEDVVASMLSYTFKSELNLNKNIAEVPEESFSRERFSKRSNGRSRSRFRGNSGKSNGRRSFSGKSNGSSNGRGRFRGNSGKSKFRSRR